MKKKAKQVIFSVWGDKKAPATYWSDIGHLAEMIGYALEGSMTGYRTECYHMSTIAVQQVKEKFGQARVYCVLGNAENVARKWNREHKTTQLHNDGNVTLSVSCASRPTNEFCRQCCVEDAKWYRHVYRTFVSLVPHYKDAIVGAADMGELLYDSFEEMKAAQESSTLFTEEEFREIYGVTKDDLQAG